MTRYTATIHHHSIASARVENVGEILAAAKRNATREFGGEHIDYEIIIRDTTLPEYPGNMVARRKVGAPGWAAT